MNSTIEVLPPPQVSEHPEFEEWGVPAQQMVETAFPVGAINLIKVRDLAKELRQAAHALITSTQGREVRIGFTEQAAPPIAADYLMQQLTFAVAQLENILTEDGDRSPLSINSRAAAHNLQVHAESLSSWLEENTRTGKVPQGRRSLTHQQMLSFKTEMSGLIQRLDVVLAPLTESEGAN